LNNVQEVKFPAFRKAVKNVQLAERRKKLREELIRAAERRIESHGLSGLRARDLAGEVGCAVGAIYNVFPDLDALILAVNARTLKAFEAFVAQENANELARPPLSAVVRLVALASSYLEFAVAHHRRWAALFQHRMTEGRLVPDWYLAEQERLFRHVETPLRDLRPELDDRERTMLARTLFAAVHGVVSIGLDEKLAPMPLPALRQQLAEIVDAIGAGLSRH